MLSSWRELGRFVFGKQRSGRKNKEARIRERLAAAGACVVESLEARQLLSVLPAPTINQHVNLSGGTNQQNMSNPAVAYDPSNPLKLATVYTRYEPSVPGRQKAFLEGSYSADGGVSWVGFNIPRNDPNWTIDPASTNDRTIQRATDAAVAIGRDEQIYITFLEHDDDNAVGAVMFYKFDFSGGSPQPVQVDANRPNGGRRIYTWVNQDPALTPMIAVDNNVDDFIDPDTGAEQIDPYVGNVYIAWNTNNNLPTNANPALFNQNAIKLMGSNDGGVSFSTLQIVNDNQHGMRFGGRPEGRMSTPRLVVSQGTVPDALSGEPRVTGGQLAIVWDDYTGTGGGGNDTDIIWSDRVVDGVKGVEAIGAVGPIMDAVQNGGANTPTDTDFIATVNITDDPADPFVLADLDVHIALTHPALPELHAQLIAPDGTAVDLFLNGVDAAGQTIPNQGLNGTDLGVILAGQSRSTLETVFDDDASRSIRDQGAAAGYVAHFRPEGGTLSDFIGFTPTELNGDWTLRITDFVNSQGGQVAPAVRAWSIQMTSNLTTERDNVVANTRVRGAMAAPFPLAPAVSPTQGIGPAPTVAADNTLGSFSPFQGRIYVAYVGKESDTNDDSGIFLAFSDDGALSWTRGIPVNQDTPDDGFSGGNRPQFQPEIAVDQSTGTVVLSWLDARHDAARARVSTYIGTSIDGGETFGPDTYANVPNQATDAITGEIVNLEPIPDNQSAGNPNTEQVFGFGTRQGLAVVDGRVTPVWSGNLNGGLDGNRRLQILSTVVRIATGPRIIDSTVGPVSVNDPLNPPLPDGTPRLQQFIVTLDRPVDPDTFTEADVTVTYRDVNTLGIAPGLNVPVASVEPLDFGVFGPAEAEGATQFLVTLVDAWSDIGTYSYAIAPTVEDRIRHFSLGVAPNDTNTFDAVLPQVPRRIPAIGTGGSGDPVKDRTNSTITVNGLPAGDVITDVNITLSLTHANDSQLRLTLISPTGTRIVLADQVGFFGANFDNTVFDDNATLPIISGFAPFDDTFRPTEPLSVLNGRDPNGIWTLEVEDLVLGTTGTLTAWSMEIETGTPGFTLINGNNIDQNSNGVQGEFATPNTGLGDVYAVPTPSLPTSFNGDYFTPPFERDSLPLIITGPRVIKSQLSDLFNPDPTQVNLTVPTSGDGGSGDPALDVTTSTITINQPGVNISDLNVTLNLIHPDTSDLTIYLVTPTGQKILLALNELGSNFTNTTFDDDSLNPIFLGTSPYSGAYSSEDAATFFGGLEQLVGTPISGTWALEIHDDVAGNSGTLVSWDLVNSSADDNLALNHKVSSLDVVFDRDMDPTTVVPGNILRMVGPVGQITGPFTITANPLGTDPDPLHPRTFHIGFAEQHLSGTYTIQLASSIKDKNGTPLDMNFNAGLDALRGISTMPPIQVSFAMTGAAKTIGSTAGPNRVTTSTIDVPDDFIIQGARVKLNITYANDPDLEAWLLAPFNDPATGQPMMIRLFTNVGNQPINKANFKDTEFDDNARSPIQNGGAPFFGKFNPQDPLSGLIGMPSGGTWTLVIKDDAAGRLGTLNSWSLSFDKPVPGTGLGETVADQAVVSYRIFTQDPGNLLSHSTWTAVGGASNNGNGNSGRIGGLAMDPSDPSGNTVYVAGASGGVWRTTNFLTTSEEGPTYIPLTDLAPTFGLNIGGIAVFARDNDPRKSIVIVGTGEGDTASASSRSPGGSNGVGFLRSMDAGLTWTVLDSTTNVDANGNVLPMNSPLRDHVFAGTATFKVIVDPRPTTSGGTIVYAALTGANGGIWRSLDTGNHWQLMRAGDATDVAFENNSGTFDTFSNPTGNIQAIYAAFRGDGVYRSPNRGQVWNQLLGTVGDPLIQDHSDPPAPHAVAVDAPDRLPTGQQGRISIVTPFLTGNPSQDLAYQGWIYAVVANTAGALHGLFLSKDFGQNWTHVRIPTTHSNGLSNGVPSNDPNEADTPVFGGELGFGAQGNYDQSIAISPLDPKIVYVGGTLDGSPTGYIRVDVTHMSDPHAFYQANDRADGGLRRIDSVDPVRLDTDPRVGTTGFPDPVNNPYINLIRDPNSPFLGNATVHVGNIDAFSNTGIGARWKAFDIEGTDQHRVITFVDPTTGKGRIIIGDDQGVFTALDDDGTMVAGVENIAGVVGEASRNGNIQITQLYYGAAQPSFLAAQIAGAMFYGQAQDNGSVTSRPDVLDSGEIGWFGPEGDGTGVATDQTGSGTYYLYNWPCCGGNRTDFFMVNGIGRTFGLLQDSQQGNTPDPQWPYLGGSNFAVNPISSNQIIMSSQAGRIFGTSDQGRVWSEIGKPAVLDGSYAPALAFGAPDPNGPGGVDATNFYLLAGTSAGKIFVTFTGGGANGDQWIDISNGLDGSGVNAIVANPLRGSHDAYAVTSRGVYFMADTRVQGGAWTNITGNLFAIGHNAFNDPTLPELNGGRMRAISSMVADWRYFFPDSGGGGTTHPILFVGGEGGVYRSLDKGATWSLFPDTGIDGAEQAGGYLPNAHVTDLDLALGNVDPTTGQPDVSTGPDVLLASTYGRGSFVIRLAPIILPGSVTLTPNSVVNNTSGTTAHGISAPTAFGNVVRISIVDVTDPNNEVVVGGYDGTPATDIPANWTDLLGNFSVLIDATKFITDGTRTIAIRATDESGTTSTDTLKTVIVDNTPPIVGTGGFNFNATEGSATGNVTVATFTDPGPARPLSAYSATIDWGDGTTPSAGTITFDSNTGIFTVTGNHVFANPGTLTVKTTIVRGGTTVSVNSVATVANPAVIPTGGFTFSAGRGVNSTGIVATFLDPGGPELVSQYVATINWGDGTPTSTGTISFNSGNNVYTVTGSHNYGAIGSFTITVTIAHTTAPNASTTSTAIVAVPGVTVTGGLTFTGAEGTASSTQPVATFTDPNGAGALNNYSATIDWGDGTATSAGTITVNGGTGVFTVAGSHRYTEEGAYTIIVTVHRTGSADATGVSSANIIDVPVLGTGGFTYSSPIGVPGTVQTVATFTDPAGPEALNEYSATILWGDNTPADAATITFNSSTGVFSVQGSHTYLRDGTFTVQIKIQHGTATDTIVVSSATVTHPPLIITGGFTFNAVEGQSAISQVLATFIDPLGEPAPLSSFAATINWGDGTSSAGLISIDPISGIFSVNGSHKYSEEGSQTITVTVRHSTAPNAVTTSTASISDPAVAPGTPITVNGVEGIGISGTVATFTDPGGPEAVGDYTATISWGDGSTSAGTITFDSVSKKFSVAGSHTYADDATYTIQTTIKHDTAPDAQAIGTALITPAPVNATAGAGFSLVEGTSSGNRTLATFTDPGTPDAPSSYTANITWGDGSTSTGTITFNAGVFSVAGAHTYAKKGTFTVSVAIAHGTAAARTVTLTATVSNAALTVTANPLIVSEGVAFNGAVGSFVDANSLSVAGDFTAKINWGDGTAVTNGTITVDPNNSSRFIVNGTHTYAEGPASRTITLTILDVPDNQTTVKSAGVTVNNVKPVVTVTAPSKIYRGIGATFTLKTTDTPGDMAAGFKYVITWGDGTTQTIGPKAANATRNVAHTYTTTGAKTVTVKATDRDGATSNTISTAVIVLAPPTLVSSSINGGLKQRSRIMNVSFVLSQDVGLTKGKLTLTRGTTNVSLANASFTWDGSTKTGNLTLSGVSLTDGDYKLAVDTGGGVLNINFFRLAGDADGNRVVNNTDLNIVNASLGKSSGQAGFNANADLNVDGKVDSKDKALVTNNMGHTV